MELRSGSNPSPNPDWTIWSGSKPGPQLGNPELLLTLILLGHPSQHFWFLFYHYLPLRKVDLEYVPVDDSTHICLVVH
jgi:hypothetical protein